MATGTRREDKIIALFLSAFEEGAWKDAKVTPVDQLVDGGVEVIATRCDGKTLAIEHTLIEPFIGDRADFARSRRFQAIEQDPVLLLRDRISYVDVPSGALPNRTNWNAVIDCVHDWLRDNLAAIPPGKKDVYECPIMGAGPNAPASLKLQISIVPSPGSEWHPIIRRYGPIDIGAAVEKALSEKLPKLVTTPADLRLLMLERNQWALDECVIWREINSRRSRFPGLSKVSEVWFAATAFYDGSVGPGWRDVLEFHRYEGEEGQQIASYQFYRGVLIMKERNGFSEVTEDGRSLLR